MPAPAVFPIQLGAAASIQRSSPTAKMLGYYAARFDRRDQQHLLPDAAPEHARALGGRDARRLSGSRSRARSASPTSKRLADVDDAVTRLATEARGARRQARADAVPAPAVSEEGRAAAGGVSARCALRARRCARRSSSATSPGSTDDVYAALARARRRAVHRRRGGAGDARSIATAHWGYLRLRRQDYDEAALAAWAERVRAQPWDDAYVFFKHEDEGQGRPLPPLPKHDRPREPLSGKFALRMHVGPTTAHMPWRERSRAPPSRSVWSRSR